MFPFEIVFDHMNRCVAEFFLECFVFEESLHRLGKRKRIIRMDDKAVFSGKDNIMRPADVGGDNGKS